MPLGSRLDMGIMEWISTLFSLLVGHLVQCTAFTTLPGNCGFCTEACTGQAVDTYIQEE